MNPTRPSDRRRRRASFQPETLETRNLMTSGAGNTFAIMTASLTAATPKVVVPFEYQPSLMTLNSRHQMTLGIDVAAQSGSTAQPKIVGVEDMQTHRMIPFTRTMYSRDVQLANPQQGKQTSAVQVNLRFNASQATQPHQYAVVVQSQGGTSGNILVGFYLPGDAAGSGTVDNNSLAAIKQANGINASSQNYNFAADANRDGVINSKDLALAKQNVGVSTKVTPVVSANLSPLSDSGIADRITNIQTVQFLGTATPGATISYTDTDNTAPVTTTTAGADGKYSLQIPLGIGTNTFKVSATDPFGQTITGSIAPVTYTANAPTAVTTLPVTTQVVSPSTTS